MDIDPQAMTRAMGKEFAIAGIGDDIARRLVDGLG